MAVWAARDSKSDNMFVALFNLSDKTRTVTVSWNELDLENNTHTVTNLWTSKKTKHEDKVAIELPAHGSFLGKIYK